MNLRFESLTLENFAIYPNVELEFSVDDKHPLTLIKGENNSGKTTLMRAFVWMLFGESHVPGLTNELHPIRPAWAEGDVITTGELDFRAEHSKVEVTRYKLIRRGRTSIKSGRVVYDSDELKLLRDEVGTGFVLANERLEVLQSQYFPVGMKEFIVIDADKANQMVGGSASTPDVQLMRDTTTTAVRELLGLEPIRRVSKRVRDIASSSMSSAARSSGDRDLEALGKLENELKVKLDAQEALVHQLEIDVENARTASALSQVKFESHVSEIDELKELRDEISKLQREREVLLGSRRQCIAQLSDLMKSEQALASLIAPVLASLVRTLEPLKEQGRIPATEISLLPRLLAEDVCLCGIKFSEHPDRKAEVERRIALSVPQRAEANFGDQCLEAARATFNRALGPGAVNWSDQMEEIRSELGDIDQRLQGTISLIERLGEDLLNRGGANSEFLQEVLRNHEVLRQQTNASERELDAAKSLLSSQRSDHRSASERLRLAQTKSVRLVEAQNTAKVAEILADVIVHAQEIIEVEQVAKIDTTVDGVFKDIVGVGEDSHYEHVGIRHADGEQGFYEPYVLGSRGVELPIAIVNGASRRAISVAIVVALSEVTGTSIPFIADSILGNTSGSVKLGLVDYLTSGKQVGQPIVFASRDDLLGEATDTEGRRVLDLVKERAGVTYTVTSQAEVGRNVVRRDLNGSHPKQSVLCRCGADEYCETCERVGDESSSYLTVRTGA